MWKRCKIRVECPFSFTRMINKIVSAPYVSLHILGQKATKFVKTHNGGAK